MNRIESIAGQVSAPVKKETLSVTDNRTGKSYEIAIKHNYIEANELKKIKNEQGGILRSYDPGFMNTISCTSKISFIDGDKGILEYRGIPIEQLAEKSSFLEVAFLLIFGELPTRPQLAKWENKIMTHTFVHQDVIKYSTEFGLMSHHYPFMF